MYQGKLKTAGCNRRNNFASLVILLIKILFTTGRAKKKEAPHEEIKLLKIFPTNILALVSPISSPSNALHSIKFCHIIHETLQFSNNRVNHRSALMGYFVEKELVCKFLCH